MSLFDGVNKDGSNSPVQSKGPAILLPAEAIGNVVTKTNTLILEHQDWLANLPRQKERIKRQSDKISPPQSLITPAPSLKHSALNPFVPRQNLVLPECNSISASAFNAGVIVGAASASTQLQSSILSAKSALASAQLSAAIALSTASVSAQAAASVQVISVSVSVLSSASSVVSVARASASSAVASAKASASSVVLTAQSSANAVILSATNALSSVQASASSALSSASSAVVSANGAAADARASASLAIQSAMASVISAQQSASATKTVLALTITFSVIGSSLITILIIYLITRCQRNRRKRKQSELKERIHRIRHESDESMAPSLSAFPLPGGRKNWITRSRPNTVETAEISGTGTGMLSGSPTLLNSGPLQGSTTRQIWAPTREAMERGGQRSQSDMDLGFSGSGGLGSNPNQGQKDIRKNRAAREAILEERPTGMVRKNSLTYDSEHPGRPPKFTTCLDESSRSVSPFPNTENDERFSGISSMGKGKRRMSSCLGQKKQSLMQRRRSRSMGEVSDIGTAI